MNTDMVHIADITHNVVDHTKHTVETIIHVLESKENIAELFEETWWAHFHEHWFLHAGEMMFSRVMMLAWG